MTSRQALDRLEALVDRETPIDFAAFVDFAEEVVDLLEGLEQHGFRVPVDHVLTASAAEARRRIDRHLSLLTARPKTRTRRRGRMPRRRRRARCAASGRAPPDRPRLANLRALLRRLVR